MKKLFATRFMLAAVLACTLAITSCNKEDVIFVQNLADWQGCIPANPNDGTTNYTYTLTKSEIEAAFSAAGSQYNHDRVKNLKLKQIKASITTNAVATNFNNIGGFELYAKGISASGEGTQIAYINNIPDGTTEVTMLLNGAELKELLHETAIVLTLRASTKLGGHDELCIKLINGQLEYNLSAK